MCNCAAKIFAYGRPNSPWQRMLQARKGELWLMLTPARLPKRSPRRLRKFYAMIVKVFIPPGWRNWQTQGLAFLRCGV
jgi:hypothetical protein